MVCCEQTYQAPPNSGEVFLGRTLPSLLDEACRRSPNQTAFNQRVKSTWQSLSNQAFQSAVEEVACGLLDLQLEKGDRVALLMHSDINLAIADMGTLLAGLVNVPIDITQTIEHIVFILHHSEAKVLIVSNLNLFNQIASYLPDISSLQRVIVAEEEGERRGRGDAESIFSLHELRSRGKALISEERCVQLRTELAPDNLASIVYIPGVTGEPVGVMLTHENLSGNALAAFSGIPNLELGAKEVVLSFLPLTHVFARVLLYGHLNYGHSIYFTTITKVMKLIPEVKPTIFATVPLFLEKFYSKILEEAKRGRGDTGIRGRGDKGTRGQGDKETRRHGGTRRQENLFSPSPPPSPQRLILKWSLNLAKKYKLGEIPRGRYALMLKLFDRLVFSKWRVVFGGNLKYLICGGASLKAEIANLLAAARITVLQGYGLTETASAVTCCRGEYNYAGTVGVALPGVEIAIATDGEILTRSPYMTQGYYKNQAATQKLIDVDGWLHTGDLGKINKAGFLQITGLKKSRFKLSTGKYVTPEPLESKLEKSSLVAKAVTVGSERKFCSMLIFPHLENLHEYALSVGLNLASETLLKHPCIIALYQMLVDEANCHLPYWSTIKRFQLINYSLTIENGGLTANQQVNRAQVAEIFAPEINAMYGEVWGRDWEKRGQLDAGKISDLNEICPVIPTSYCPVYAQSLSS
ncbi:AMP-dependent synthetase/ligase [Calothrix sp. UHCC 0171]|uniref:AMP-dependent synthetase/ligase n=1 Tax=Calothrix sp. UHCC 0171 TaxID=3110245 RepID=UPI002B20FE8D|nr:AMP-binding protein [Calothrix sp. UHCC 0171]MEA5572578.1 AMP-binding protein [Calothrix sp. UHCC 0171]